MKFNELLLMLVIIILTGYGVCLYFLFKCKNVTPIREIVNRCACRFNIKDFESVYINLDRREDRRKNFENIMKNINLIITRFQAIDGYHLKTPLNPQLYHLFDKNNYNYRSGVIGCALSHISILINYINNNDSKKYLMVMEDDLYFNDKYHKNGIGFEDTLNNCLIKMDEMNADIMCLQYLPIIKNDNVKTVEKPVFKILKANEALSFSYGGTSCYIITKIGAIKLLNFIHKNGMTEPIDTMILRSADNLKLVYVEPLYVIADVLSLETQVDTDIQNNFENLNCSLDELINSEMEWLSKNYNLLLNQHYTITTDCCTMTEYSYPLKNAWVNLKIQPSIQFKYDRPNQRLKVNNQFHINIC